MKLTHRYIGWISRHSLSALLLRIFAYYLSIMLVFSCIYYFCCNSEDITIKDNDNKTITDFGDCCYFSFVTQSTLGYGDFAPDDFISKFLVIIQAFLGMGFLAIGTGTILARAVIPNSKDIWFHDKMLYDYKDKCFKIVLANNLPMDLFMAKINFCVSFYDPNMRTNRVKDVELLKGEIDLLSNKGEPFILFTKTFQDNSLRELTGYGVDDTILLEPKHIKERITFEITMVAQHFIGTIGTSKSYDPLKDIMCGRFPESFFMGEPPNKNQKEHFRKMKKAECERECTYPDKSKCYLKIYLD